jgi:hypothetical protein
MGSLSAKAMAEMNEVTLEQQLAWHLQSNHFPPVPANMVQPCIEAIDAYNDEDYQKLISLPEGVGYRGLTAAPASAIIEAHHLDAWLNHNPDCDCDDCVFTEEEEEVV